MKADRRFHPGWRALILAIGFAACDAPVSAQAPSSPAPMATPAAPFAGKAVPAAADPQLERRVMDIAELLRCLVCQNQTIADSSADLAIDLRAQIREQLRQGRDEASIMRFMVERYGDFVLYKPPLKGATLALWFGPALLIVLAAGTVFVMVRRRRAAPPADLDAAQQQTADRLLGIPPEGRP